MIDTEGLRDLGVVATPMTRLASVEPEGVRLLAKCEWHLPTGSVKDRVAAAMILAAEQDGTLRPGDRLIEPSSGNTGIALARLAALRGYALTVVAPENVSSERLSLLHGLGAEVVLSPGDLGSNGAVRHAEKLATESVMLHQYENIANPLAHRLSTGPEILADIAELGGRVDGFVASLGTGGTLMGVGESLRQASPDVRIVAAEPPVGELIAGLRTMADGYVPPIFSADRLDGRILVRTRPALQMMRRLLTEEGLFVGPSSGAAVHAAVRVAERIGPGATVVVLLPDAGWKYLSTGIYDLPVDEVADEVDALTLW